MEDVITTAIHEALQNLGLPEADFMIEHPYRVSTNSLVDTLSVVLKEYRLSATFFQGNDVIEVFMNNGELGNEIDK